MANFFVGWLVVRLECIALLSFFKPNSMSLWSDSVFSSLILLVASVWVHERQHTGQSMSQVMTEFRERFNKVPPRRATLLDWEKRAFALGSVKDMPRSGGKTTRLEACAAVAASIERSPMKSTRKRSSELGVPRSTMRDHMKKDLNARPYRLTFVNELSDGDMDRYESCRALLDTFSNAVSRSKVLFSDECAIYRSVRNRNVVFWSKENPNFTQELEHNPLRVMMWEGMTSDFLIGPYFFDGPVNAASYSAMLETLLIPQLRDRELLDDVRLHQDGAPAHFALSVRDILNERFPGRWIGRGSPTSPGPLPWPPRSPDLTTPDNSLWGIIKGRVAVRRYNNNNEDLNRSCGRRLSHNYSKNAPTFVTEDMEVHPFVCPASRCIYGFTGHVTKEYVSDSNQIMVTYLSVHGDFSPNLYIPHFRGLLKFVAFFT